jgi:ribosomal-protein-alanine N-acetyltransferase
MDFSLVPASTNHLRSVLNWINTPEQLRMWGGATLTFPPQVERLWQEIRADEQTTFTLIDASGNMAGFGQTLFREPHTIHLGRIIISPILRGRGLGRILVEKLIEAGEANFHPAEFTLNVYRNNDSAVGLYRSMGFNVLAEDAAQDSYKMGLKFDPNQ